MKKTRTLVTFLVILLLLLLYPFWMIFRRVVNRLSYFGIRNRKGSLQTSVRTYKHPKTGQTVVIIGAVHIADADYYAQVQERIDELTALGYTMLFEGIDKITAEEEKRLTREERRIKRYLDTSFEFITKLSDLMGLTKQKAGITYRSTWINNDISYYEMLQMLAKKKVFLIRQPGKMSEYFETHSDRLTLQWVIEKMFKNMLSLGAVVAATKLFSRAERHEKTVILDHRNEVAFSIAQKYLKGSNLVMFWGAAHLNGLGRLLKKEGFRMVGQEWLCAYQPRGYSLWKIFGELQESQLSSLPRKRRSGRV